MTLLSYSPSILLLAPQLQVPGGIQTYMRRLREIVSAYGQTRGHQTCCVSLLDRQDERSDPHTGSGEHGAFVGCRGNKMMFALKAIGLAGKYLGSLMIVGHLGQSPVAWGLKRLGIIRSYVLVIYGIEAWKKVSWLDRQAARDAECIVAITDYTAVEFCKRNDLPYERPRIIPPTLAEEEISAPLGNPEPLTELKVLTVGRLSAYDRLKGIDTLISAVHKAGQAGAKLRLRIVGDGDDKGSLENLVARLGLDGQVDFVGWVPEDKLHHFYQACDVFAMPSKKEGFGIVFLEAMRYGKPCIGGNYGGTPEVITHGVDGYLVDYGDVHQLARYLIEFLQRPEIRREMGLKGYEKVKARYLFSHMRDNWFALLDELIGK